MQYSKDMIQLVFEIRRRTDAATKPAIKLTNPELLAALRQLFHQNRDPVLRALVRELFNLAGEDPDRALKEEETPEQPSTLRVYRGQRSLEPKRTSNAPSSNSEEAQERKPVRYYRGVRRD